MNFDKSLTSVQRELDQVSPSFCLAKWLQVTIHLQNGFNHSCHHPELHKIPLEELRNNPAALHNTKYKKALREQMLTGKRPAECDYCWKVEDAPGKNFSDRVIKSNDAWARPRLGELASAPSSLDVNPSYVEVSFGNECNFHCLYCLPHVSSSVWASFEKHGPLVFQPSIEHVTRLGQKPYGAGEKNPYVEAFWEWFPSLSKDLRVFRITGGEPLINPNTFRVLEYIDRNPLPHLELCVNSNLGIPDRFFDAFLGQVRKLTDEKKIKSFMLFTSIDTHGAQAEYLRRGLKYDRWLRNVRKYLQELPWTLAYMVTFNALSPASFPRLLDDLLEVNREFPTPVSRGANKRAWVDVSYLRHPEYLSPWVLSDRWRAKIDEAAAHMARFPKERIGGAGFTDYEIHKLRRVSAWVKTMDGGSALARKHRSRFYTFTQQVEEREKLKFLDVFPEMEDYLALCERDFAEFPLAADPLADAAATDVIPPSPPLPGAELGAAT